MNVNINPFKLLSDDVVEHFLPRETMSDDVVGRPHKNSSWKVSKHLTVQY